MSYQALLGFARKHRHELAKWVPKPVGRIPYAASLAYLKSKVKSELSEDAPEIWARHGYITDAFTPFVSDLDLTFWYENSPSVKSVRAAMNVHSNAKRHMPWLSEVNLYVREEAEPSVFAANSCELLRDPLLVKRLKRSEPEPSVAESVVFLLRILESDFEHLLAAPERRRAKWQGYFRLAGIPEFRSFTVEGLVSAALAGLEFETGAERSAAESSLLGYYRDRAAGKAFHEIPVDATRWSFLPHRYVFQDLEFPVITGPLQDVTIAQLSWELWGILGQYRLLLLGGMQSQRDLLRYLESLYRFTRSSVGAASYGADLSDGISVLIERVKEMEIR